MRLCSRGRYNVSSLGAPDYRLTQLSSGAGGYADGGAKQRPGSSTDLICSPFSTMEGVVKTSSAWLTEKRRGPGFTESQERADRSSDDLGRAAMSQEREPIRENSESSAL
jgi:hypothetical protein